MKERKTLGDYILFLTFPFIILMIGVGLSVFPDSIFKYALFGAISSFILGIITKIWESC